ncbi:hypothetical protein Tco_1496606 [Tanacetum coccineum]
MELHHVKQTKGESVEAFMERFTSKAISKKGVSPSNCLSYRILRRNLLARRENTPTSGLREITLPVDNMDELLSCQITLPIQWNIR